MSVKVTVERADDKPGISLKDGDVCLLRCGGVVMARDRRDGSRQPFRMSLDSHCFWFFPNGRVYENGASPWDVTEILGNGADFLKRVEVVVKVTGE
jgi:hypothetical protein